MLGLAKLRIMLQELCDLIAYFFCNLHLFACVRCGTIIFLVVAVQWPIFRIALVV